MNVLRFRDHGFYLIKCAVAGTFNDCKKHVGQISSKEELKELIDSIATKHLLETKKIIITQAQTTCQWPPNSTGVVYLIRELEGAMSRAKEEILGILLPAQERRLFHEDGLGHGEVPNFV